MFVLRCGFFLSIVYIAITFGVGLPPDPEAFRSAVPSEAASVADAVLARATRWCVERPARCADDAARLTALVQSAAIEPVFENKDVELADAEVPAIPLPVRDPRRRGARAMLTFPR